MAWFIIYTRSKQEKKVDYFLKQKGIDSYCPLFRKTQNWSDRKKIIEEPLFKSYCFVNLPEKERHLVFNTPGFVRYLFWLGKPATLKNEEIENIKNFLNDYDHSQIKIEKYQVGDVINIYSGVFQNNTAKILSQQGNKLTLILENIGYKITIDQSKNIIKKNEK